jgi:terminase large subunit-like protein
MQGNQGPRRPRVAPRLRRDQREIAQHPARFKIVACGRRWGKTSLGIIAAVGHALEGRRVWWVAPTYEMAHYPWHAFKSRFRGLWETKTEYNRHIELKNGGSITVKTAVNPDNLRGVGLDFLVVDEAAFISDEIWDQILRPTLTDTKGSAMFISTPAGRNWFHRLFQRGLDTANPHYQSWHYHTAANPRIEPEEIEEVRKSLPERVFRQEYEAEFLADGGTVFRDVRKAATAPFNAIPQPNHTYVMGVDFARFQDFTVCTVMDMNTKQMVEMLRFSGEEWNLQRSRIKALSQKWNVYSILAEHNSIGNPNIEALRNDQLPIAAFNTSTSTKPDLIDNLVIAIENGDVQILNDNVLIGELETFTYHIGAGGYTKYGAPPGGHDDTVIALALAWQAAIRPRLTLGIFEVDKW